MIVGFEREDISSVTVRRSLSSDIWFVEFMQFNEFIALVEITACCYLPTANYSFSVPGFFDYIAWSTADFHVDPANVFSNESQGENLKTNEKE